MWRLLAATPVATWWEEAADGAPAGSLRTVLDIRAPELRQLPWELLRREDPPDALFLAPGHPWARTFQQRDYHGLLVPIRMLVVLGDTGDSRLQVDEELDAIANALGPVPEKWHVDLLTEPDASELNNVLEDLRPHVLHVITHGRVDEATGEAVLATRPKPSLWEINGQDITTLPDPAPRLVVLNACRSAEGHPTQASRTFANAFLRKGSGAVITMQGNVLSRAAVPFSTAFYRKVADGVGIDVAAVHGRIAARNAMKDQGDERTWAMPCVHLATAPDRVLSVRSSLGSISPAHEQARNLVANYVDRSKERQQLVARLDPEDRSHLAPLVLVGGARKAGKSAMIRSTVLTCHLRGQLVAYVDFDKISSGRWEVALRHIRDELVQWLSQRAEEPAQRFSHDLAFLLEHREPDPYLPGSARQDRDRPFERESEDFEEWAMRSFESFRTMLRSIAGDHGLLLALDHVDRLDPQDDFVSYLPTEILAPVSRGMLPGVRVLLVATDDWLASLRDRQRGLPLPESLDVHAFDWNDVPRLGRDYAARRWSVPISPLILDVITQLRRGMSGPCNGDALTLVLAAIKLKAAQP